MVMPEDVQYNEIRPLGTQIVPYEIYIEYDIKNKQDSRMLTYIECVYSY